MPQIIIIEETTTPVDLIFRTSAEDTTDQTTYTFSSQDIGSAVSDRQVVVCIGSRANAARTLNSVTIGGVSATEVVTQNVATGGADFSSIWVADVPTGTTADVVITFSAAMLRCAIAVYKMTGADATAHDTASDVTASSNAYSASIDVPAFGAAVGHLFHSTTAGTASATWTNLTERSDRQPESASNGASSASDNFSTIQTGRVVTGTSGGTSTLGALVLASWGPA